VNAKQIWQTAIERLQTRVSPTIFTAWFQGTSALSYQDGVFIIRVPTTFAREYLERRFSAIIRTALTEIIGVQIDVQFVVAKEEPAQPEGTSGGAAPRKRPYRLLRNRHTAAQREKRIAETLTTAMNSLAPAPEQASVHRSPERNETEEETAGTYQQQLLPEQPMAMQPKVTEASTLPPLKKEDSYEESERVLKTPLPRREESTPLPRGPIILPGEGLLNPRYTFNAFIVGKSNQLAHAASFAVSENPGRIYNPLFLYGGVGLGKTHLLHAVGHVGEAAGLTVLYTTSEKFTNEIINAIRFQKTEEFRAKYRQIDILLVDDIQFIAGKESTEEEFFHTFNTLHNANKQIVVTSDRPPKAIHSLQDRLRSRFEWGLLADVQAPEYEHRLAILRSKAESLHFRIPNSVIDYIARPESSSVRELEGSLNRVIAYATLHDEPMSASVAAKALEHLYSDKKTSIGGLTISEVLAGVCRYYHVKPELLRGKQRERDIVWPRQVAMYLMREETSASLLQIGSELGGRDHTTILHGWEKVHAEMAHNDRVRHEIAAVLDSLQQRPEA
jgi:chromosomal replication initiator protein